MPLSWNEIKARALVFSKEWASEHREHAEAKSFWDAFFNIFGISRRRLAGFETAVQKLNGKQGFIDLLWKGTLMVEHKSTGKDLEKAFLQVQDYFTGLKEYELPRYILVCDFQHFNLYDLDENTQTHFGLSELVQHIHHFGFMAGYEKRTYKDSDPVNIQAAELMGKLHDALKAVHYTGHDLEQYLVRLLFCLFADDTHIFEKDIFWEYIELHTHTDGSDLAMHLHSIFHTLNTPSEQRLTNLSEHLAQFPYINGKLFEKVLAPAAFDRSMREMLLEACSLDWGKISPAIFGSMFQTVMNPQERRNLGAHYTSEINIQKLIKPLFLDDLYVEFAKILGNKPKLNEFHRKIAQLRFLDPACGCGNFLIVTYRELRDLELLVLKELYQNQLVTNVDSIINVDVDQFYGIEYDEFAVRIAEVAMWLIDHQMNLKVSHAFGQYFVRLPLRKAAKILHTNALRIDWKTIVATNDLNFILGNPPFVGSKMMSEAQRQDLLAVFKNAEGVGVLDYVTAWYAKAANLMQNTTIKTAFVSTNSVSQGEQVSILWNVLLNEYQMNIHFAHKTFKWSNEAKGNAAVYCVIIGFAQSDSSDKKIYEYETVKSEPQEIKAKNINAYLVDSTNVFIHKRSTPLCPVPAMNFGNMPLDGGFLLMTDEEKVDFVKKEPKSDKFLKPLISAREFLNNEKRWCLWLVHATPAELRAMPEVMKRVTQVKKFREASVAPSTQKFAAMPSLFRDRNNPESFIVVPRVSSENRKYIPMGFFDKTAIAGDTCMTIPNGDLYLFGQLMSRMHMTWVKYVCGRLKSDFRYSKDIVYNNYPFPQNVSEAQKQKVTDCAHKVLEIRKLYPESSLADLYDALTMPPDLVKAHQALDKAVDQC
ncbi:MAG: hypothetical protein RLZZ628_2718, partial [Bacteroidota bacterium]